MSFPDQTQPPHPVMSSSFSSGDPAAFWPPYWQQGNDHHQPPPPDTMPQFDNHPPLKKPRPSEASPHFPPQSNPRINPPNAAKGTSHIFYKTRMCAKFIEGTCKNGEHCTFAHGQGDLREPPPNWQEIVKDRGGNSGVGNSNWGGGSNDDQRTMIHRMKICKKYYNGEECPYGEKCNFLHERPSPPPMMAKRMKVDNNGAEQRESFAISVGVTGELRGNGGSDFDPKVFWKTRMCSKWEMGHCPFGDRCHYAHGQSELKFSGNVDEAEQVVMNAMMASNIPRNPSSLSAFSNTPALANLAAPINENGDNKASKWKLTKKINRIYADWLDDATPPHLSPNDERMM